MPINKFVSFNKPFLKKAKGTKSTHLAPTEGKPMKLRDMPTVKNPPQHGRKVGRVPEDKSKF